MALRVCTLLVCVFIRIFVIPSANSFFSAFPIFLSVLNIQVTTDGLSSFRVYLALSSPIFLLKFRSFADHHHLDFLSLPPDIYSLLSGVYFLLF